MIRSSLLLFHLWAVLVPSAMALNILLTSEDGIDQPGLAALRKELLIKHSVYTFAPKEDQSGMGAALSMPTVQVEEYGPPEDNMWAVHGYPSSAVLVGLAMMKKEPDLIISGINVGYTSGPMDVHSSAVTQVLTGLGKNVPSFCIMTNLAEDMDEAAHFEDASIFVAHMVDVLVDQMVVFPIGVGLKIGYPARLPKDIPKVILAGYGTYNPFSYGYYPTPQKGVFQLGPAPSAQKFHEDSDAQLVEAGNIGVLAITNDISMHKKVDNAYFLDDIGAILAETDARWTQNDGASA